MPRNDSKATRLERRLLLKGTLELKSGLHIGAGRDAVKIGGLDNPVVRSVMRDNQPYVPGSSLKGKMRSLVELSEGVDCTSHQDRNDHCVVCKVFGGSVANDNNHASRLIFRDAYLQEEDARKLQEADTDYPYTEVKAETAIDRLTGRAKGKTLRQTERIPAGVRFEVEVVVNVFRGDNEPTEDEIRKLFTRGLKLLNSDYLGGSGSRGYGYVALHFNEVEEVWRNEESADSAFISIEDWKHGLSASGK